MPNQRKAWDLNPHGGEAARFSKPARRAVSGYLPYSMDRPGNRTPISWLQARHLPVGRAAHVLSQVRLGIEPSLPPYHGGVQPQHLQTNVFSNCSGPGWNRTITFLVVTQVSSPLDHGIKLSVTEVGVEPTGREGLSFAALPICVPRYRSVPERI